jgi:hypothetical protein
VHVRDLSRSAGWLVICKSGAATKATNPTQETDPMITIDNLHLDAVTGGVSNTKLQILEDLAVAVRNTAKGQNVKRLKALGGKGGAEQILEREIETSKLYKP